MEKDLKIHILPTGALLLTGENEALLMGGGFPVETLCEILAPYRKKMTGLLIPCEHAHRMRGLYELFMQWELPLLAHWRVILPELCRRTPQLPPQVLTDLRQNEWHCGQFSIHSFPVKYDSLHPCGWAVGIGGRTIGIVQDGRLTEKSLPVLKCCDSVVLNNCRETSGGDFSLSAKRIRSVYPTKEEQEAQLRASGLFLPEFPVMELIPAKKGERN